MFVHIGLILLASAWSVQGITVKSRYYPRYHLAAPYGWMNDPNGFCYYKGEYHLFYQYSPKSSHAPGIASWGHATSTNLFDWKHLPVAMHPDTPYDKTGVFSGSAIVEDDTMYLFYTGNVALENQDPDHEEFQALATSTDGVNFKKYELNPILNITSLQPNLRDPAVWKHGDKYYMVLGHSIDGTRGDILLFRSDDKLNWEQVSVLAESDGSLGFMFECPDFFELDGRFVLLFSPQGIEPQGDKYKNLFQSGYFVGTFDYDTCEFKIDGGFRELDFGHDFYATQTIDHFGQRILVAWMDMWDRKYPEEDDGFAGLMVIPRVLSLTCDGILLQNPVREIYDIEDKQLYIGGGPVTKRVQLVDKTGVISVKASKFQNLNVYIESRGTNQSSVVVSYDAINGKISLLRTGNDGLRRTDWRPRGAYMNLKIYVDASSVEVFCGYGEVTITSRFFPNGPVFVRTATNGYSSVQIASLKRTVPVPNDFLVRQIVRSPLPFVGN